MSKDVVLAGALSESVSGAEVTHEELGRQYCRDTGTRLRLCFDKYGVHYEFRDPSIGDEWQYGDALIWQGSRGETLSAAYEVFFDDVVSAEENP